MVLLLVAGSMRIGPPLDVVIKMRWLIEQIFQ